MYRSARKICIGKSKIDICRAGRLEGMVYPSGLFVFESVEPEFTLANEVNEYRKRFCKNP